MTQSVKKNLVDQEFVPNSDAKSTTPVGDRIRDRRLAKKKSIADLSEKLKISEQYLSAIEEENMSSLPSTSYTLGFVRSLAKCLNLDPVELCQAYKKQILDKTGTKENDQEIRMIIPQKKPTKNYVVLGLGMTLVISLIGIYYMFMDSLTLSKLEEFFL